MTKSIENQTNFDEKSIENRPGQANPFRTPKTTPNGTQLREQNLSKNGAGGEVASEADLGPNLARFWDEFSIRIWVMFGSIWGRTFGSNFW